MIVPYDLSGFCTAFSTDRKGGVGTGCYSSFNCNIYCGDNEDAVKENRRILLSHLGISEDRLVIPHQTHSDHILDIDKDFMMLTQDERARMTEDKDALVTNLSGVLIGVSTADCIPVLLIDERRKVAAAIHAGWRGTEKGIVRKTVLHMQKDYNSNSCDIKAVIGPGISLESFEVGDEVYEAFRNSGFDMDSIATRYEKWHIDLKKCNRMQLLETGLKEENIHTSPVCTFTSYEEYFSARRLGILSGRILSAIMIN